MDKVKAIEVLKPLANSFVDYANITMKEEDDDTAEALEMAIDALAQSEIVRCGECERSEVGGCELYCMEWMRYTSYDGYCHRGMKRRIE